MRYLIIFVLFLSYSFSYGCSCFEPSTKKGFAKIVRGADIVVEGEFVASIHHDNNNREKENLKNQGSDILFKVTKVIKGKLNQDIIAINQWGMDNCSQIFESSGKYLIIGYELRGFQSKKEEYQQSINSKDEELVPIYPPESIKRINKNRILISFQKDKKATDYWQEILKNYRVFRTSSCSTFEPNSLSAKSIKNK